MKRSAVLLTTVYCFALCLVISCAPMHRSQSGGKDILAKSIRKAWDARISGNWEIVYDMTTKKYKKLVKKELFLRHPKVPVVKYSIKDIEIVKPGKEAIAHIDFTMRPRGFEFRTKDFKEKWIYEDGSWHVALPPPTPPIFNTIRKSKKR